jgi:DNA-binding PadR family transcriptional regulator
MDALDRTTVTVLRELLEADRPQREHYGYDLMRRLHLSSAELYPILARLRSLGWVEAGREQPEPGASAPPRRTYRLTPLGAMAARDALAMMAERDFRTSPRLLLPAGGVA